MPDKKLYVEIVVDDKGAVTTLKAIDDQGGKLVGRFKQMGDGVDQFEKRLKNGAGQGAFFGTMLADQVQKIGAWGTSIVTHSAAAGARLQQLAGVAEFLGGRAGHSAEAIHAQAAAMQRTGITGKESYETIIQLIRYNFDLATATKLQAAAQNAASIAGKSSSEVLGSMVHGIITLQPEVLRTAGFTVTLEQAMREWAKTSGKSASTLSEQQKQQLLMNAVLKEGERISGIYGKSMEFASKQQQSATRAWEQAAEALGTKLLPATDIVYKGNLKLGEIVRDNAAEFGLLGGAVGTIAGSLLGLKVLSTVSDWMGGAAGATKLLTSSWLGAGGLVLATGAVTYAVTSLVLKLIDWNGVIDGVIRKYDLMGVAAQEAGAKQDVINRALSMGAKQGISYADAIKFVADKNRAHAEGLAAVAEAQRKANEGKASARIAAEALKLSQDALNKASETYHTEVDGIAAGLKLAIENMDKMGKSTKEVAEMFKISEDSVKRYKDELEAAKKKMKELGDENDKLGKFIIAQNEQRLEAQRSYHSQDFAAQVAHLNRKKQLEIEDAEREFTTMANKNIAKLAIERNYQEQLRALRISSEMALLKEIDAMEAENDARQKAAGRFGTLPQDARTPAQQGVDREYAGRLASLEQLQLKAQQMGLQQELERLTRMRDALQDEYEAALISAASATSAAAQVTETATASLASNATAQGTVAQGAQSAAFGLVNLAKGIDLVTQQTAIGVMNSGIGGGRGGVIGAGGGVPVNTGGIQFGNFAEAFKQFSQRYGGGALGGFMGGGPTEDFISWALKWGLASRGGGLQGFATGMDDVRDFGNGTPVVLHGREIVQTEKQFNARGGGVRIGDIHIHGAVDSEQRVRQVAREVSNEILRKLDSRRKSTLSAH